ncbi:Piso0_004631 [Millerozyma farinosa CBS 7064]|uniref:DNA helicase n=1 Tax=Pichia sorbitophila (strain ATCC MYA-4447 / BCRC 22081 / CBS 7064 / NBRC 10061 / NRRL Y-12695) TaxID=559304 RepID=G8Y9B5_PICSO|nr:Piso0_004631 [Millerozyma farinosa CBS 7064]CCE85060.1 Piso0_004631 [Millerozyma farinosa CBS 7064]
MYNNNQTSDNHLNGTSDTPTKSPYVQVPSSSPIYVASSPNKQESSNLIPPSRTQIDAEVDIDEERQKRLEAKRQAIRSHKDFPMVRRRFYYLQESDVFKGFVKGKGNLRDITQWLTDNFNKNEILGKREEELRKQREKAREERLKQERERLLSEYEKSVALDKQRAEEKEHEASQEELMDRNRDNDDVKIMERPKERTPSFTPQPPAPKAEPEIGFSSKVQIQKPKVSILDKYKFRQGYQPSIDQSLKQGQGQVKKRRLVRGSHENTPEPGKPSLISFGYNGEQIPKFEKTQDGHIVKKEQQESPEDDLEKLEEKIRANRKARAASRPSRSKKHDTDEELEDDDDSDDMSDEADSNQYNNGFTSIDTQILEFLNNATVQDMCEICNVPPKVAEVIIGKRPFESVFSIAADNFDLDNESANENKRRHQKKTLGQKIVENTEFSLKGYKAVDSLIKKCSEYGNLISKQMEQWGVTVSGEGELEMVDIMPSQEVVEFTPAQDEDESENEDVVIVKSKRKGLKYISEKPDLLAPEVDLKNYQQVGINWLNLLYCNNLSCILADEMGLGKTCQVISFMAHLKGSQEKKGPHLVVVPSSTLENWLREFQKFCPSLIVQAYYGSQKERAELRYELETSDYDVLVTTYNLATGAAPDFKFLRNQDFDIVIYDEGHMLKNSTSERYNKLMRLKARFRLLLTGTPLQNNLKELVSLLAFILPKLFNDRREDLQGLFHQKVSTADTSDKSYNPLLSVQAITKAKTMMTPFVLRRKKNQVLKHLPRKVHSVVSCKLNESQYNIYHQYLAQGKKTRMERERRKAMNSKEYEKARKTQIPSSSNVVMSLRKAALHPLLFRTIYDDSMIEEMSKAIMKEPEYVSANKEYIIEDMKVMVDYELNNLCEKFPKTLGRYILKESDWLNSGKVDQLLQLINVIISKKEKLLIFSLFTQMLDIIEKVLSFKKLKFLRLDGQTTVDTRQDLIDQFYEDDTIYIFLLSTKAGGFGINLVAANNVIIFDQSFNPHDDKQAEDRAHRVGQEKEVTVTKLISENTIEQNMLQLAENKLQLDQSISGDDLSDSKFEEKAVSLFEKILFDS